MDLQETITERVRSGVQLDDLVRTIDGYQPYEIRKAYDKATLHIAICDHVADGLTARQALKAAIKQVPDADVPPWEIEEMADEAYRANIEKDMRKHSEFFSVNPMPVYLSTQIDKVLQQCIADGDHQNALRAADMLYSAFSDSSVAHAFEDYGGGVGGLDKLSTSKLEQLERFLLDDGDDDED